MSEQPTLIEMKAAIATIRRFADDLNPVHIRRLIYAVANTIETIVDDHAFDSQPRDE